MTDTLPLVTLGVPVRNGAAMLRAALDSIVAQDYPNIEIIVSDNASDDATPEILAEYAARHPNMRVVRQEKALTAIDNFIFVLKEAKGEFFAWCAHDDTRSPDFISGLVRGLGNPVTILAFGDLYIWDGAERKSLRSDYDFENVGLNVRQRLRKAADMQCYHVYGLWRTSALRTVRYSYTHWWSDMPIVLAAATLGNFRHVSGPEFYYYEIIKPSEMTARYHNQLVHKGRMHDIWSLLRATFLTVVRTSGFRPGVIATFCIFEKYRKRAFEVALGRLNILQ